MTIAIRQRDAACALVLVASAIVLSSCDRSTPYRVGVALDEDGIRGATLGAERINATGGIDGHPLELVRERSTSSEPQYFMRMLGRYPYVDSAVPALVRNTGKD